MNQTGSDERGVVLVTGASGFTGSTAVDYLLQFGYPVLATDRPGSDFNAVHRHRLFMESRPERYRGVTLEIEPADLTKPGSLKNLFKGRNVRYLMHPAAVFDMSADRQALWSVNVDGTRNLLDAAASNAPDLQGMAVWSTCMIYGGSPRSRTISEDHEPNPSNYYAESKLEQEKVVLEFHKGGLPVVILRPASVYGPRGEYGFARNLNLMAFGLHLPVTPIPGKASSLSSYVNIDDVVGAAMHLIYAIGHQEIAGNAFNVSDDTPLSAREIMAETARQLRVAEPFLEIPRAAFRMFLRIAPYGYKLPLLNMEREEIPYLFRNNIYSNNKLKQTGYTLKYPETAQGLKVTLEWYARNSKLANVWYLTHPKWRSYWKDIAIQDRSYADYALVSDSPGI